MNQSDFGTCCKDLKDAMTSPPNSFFRVSDQRERHHAPGTWPAPQGSPTDGAGRIGCENEYFGDAQPDGDVADEFGQTDGIAVANFAGGRTNKGGIAANC